MKTLLLIVLSALMSLPMSAQDDMYFVARKSVSAKKSTRVSPVSRYTYYCGSDRDVDEYNRRPSLVSKVEPLSADTSAVADTVAIDDVIAFDAEQGVYPEDVFYPDTLYIIDDDGTPVDGYYVYNDYDDYYGDYDDADDYECTRLLCRWDDCYPWYIGWYSPWYYSWYSPWYYGWYSPWYYSWCSPWYYGGWYWSWSFPVHHRSWAHPIATHNHSLAGDGRSYKSVAKGISTKDRQNSRAFAANSRSGYADGSRSGSYGGNRSYSQSQQSRGNSYMNSRNASSRSGGFSGGSFGGGSRGGGFGGGGSRGGGGGRGR